MQQYVPPPPQQPIIHHSVFQAMYDPYHPIPQSHPYSSAPFSAYLPQSAPIVEAPQPSPINSEWEAMKIALKNI